MFPKKHFHHKTFPLITFPPQNVSCLKLDVTFNKTFHLSNVYFKKVTTYEVLIIFPVNDCFYSWIIMEDGWGINIKHIYITWVVNSFLTNPTRDVLHVFTITFGIGNLALSVGWLSGDGVAVLRFLECLLDGLLAAAPGPLACPSRGARPPSPS